MIFKVCHESSICGDLPTASYTVSMSDASFATHDHLSEASSMKEFRGHYGDYSFMEKQDKFQLMLIRMKGGNLTPDEEKDLDRFRPVILKLKVLTEALLRDNKTKRYGHIHCETACISTQMALNKGDFQYQINRRHDFISNRVPSMLFGRANDFLYEFWLDTEECGHMYLSTRIAGEDFIVDVSAGQFVSQRFGDIERQNLCVFIVPLRDIDEHCWPYAIGRASKRC